ncbi:hypothetical protein HYT92_03830, partial [Candidatus Pacearchaeota archaeon]|nr:hypothetical protein [Candidatus Pacearchaeota archaeon]
MLKPYEMSSVIITGPKNVQEDIIRELYSLKVLHIVEHSRSELADIGMPLGGASELSETLVKIRALIAAFSIKKSNNNLEVSKDIPDIGYSVKKINEELNSCLEELKRIDFQLSRNEPLRQELEILKDIRIPLEHFAPYRSLACFTGHVKNGGQAERIKLQLLRKTKNFMLLESSAKKGNFIVLFVDAKNKDDAELMLKRNGFFPVNFANIQGLKGAAAQNLRKTEDEIQKLQRLKEDAKRKIERLAGKNSGFLTAAEELLSEQLEKAEAPLKFAATQSSFLIKGWIPNEELHKSIDRLNKAGRGSIYIQFAPAGKRDKVPVKLKNAGLAKPFEFFLDLYSMPSYKEIDPTFFVFLTFPIFFGIM